MKRSGVIGWLAAGLLATGASQAASVDGLVDNGVDGDIRYFSLTCSDGARGNVLAYTASARVCVQLVGGAEVCRDAWSPQDAAAAACAR